MGLNQNLFNALYDVCGFTATQDEMNCILEAVKKDEQLKGLHDKVFIIGAHAHGVGLATAVAHEFEKRGIPSVILDPELEASFAQPIKQVKIELPRLNMAFTPPPTRAERRTAKRKRN